MLDLNDSACEQESATDLEITIATAVTLATSDNQGDDTTCTADDVAISHKMRAEMERLLTENMILCEENQARHLTEQSFIRNDEKVHVYTGLSSFSVLRAVFDLISLHITSHAKCSLSQFQKLILMLKRLRLNLSVQDLAYRLNISKSRSLFVSCVTACILLSRGLFTLPMVFRRHFGLRVAVIIDCFGVFCEKPSGYAPVKSHLAMHRAIHGHHTNITTR